jgi:hypothetical protein
MMMHLEIQYYFTLKNFNFILPVKICLVLFSSFSGRNLFDGMFRTQLKTFNPRIFPNQICWIYFEMKQNRGGWFPCG